MGCFGYICKGCGTAITGDCTVGGEKCVLIHVRHGVEIGRVEGHYNEYGSVIEHDRLPETEKYRGENDGPNGHDSICDSEFALKDSYLLVQDMRVYNGKVLTFIEYIVDVLRGLFEDENDLTRENIVERVETYKILEENYPNLPVPT